MHPKRIVVYSVFIAASVLIMGGCSKKESLKDRIVGRWGVAIANVGLTGKGVAADAQEYLDSLPEESRPRMIVDYRKGGTLIITTRVLGNSKKEIRNWRVVEVDEHGGLLVETTGEKGEGSNRLLHRISFPDPDTMRVAGRDRDKVVILKREREVDHMSEGDLLPRVNAGGSELIPGEVNIAPGG